VAGLKILLFLSVCLLGVTEAQEQFEDDLFFYRPCDVVYSNAYFDIHGKTKEFNDDKVGRGELVNHLIGLDSIIRNHEPYCVLILDTRVRRCAKAFKASFKAIRNKFEIPNILLGTQQKVSEEFLDSLEIELEEIIESYSCTLEV
jgi:hypothetical protein